MNKRHWFLLTVFILGCLATRLTSVIPQDLTYHQFSDQRTLLGLPHFMDVVSNFGFLIAGVMGLYLNHKNQSLNNPVKKWLNYYCLSLMAVAVGSSYYHLAPSNESLVWDRIPMTITFSLFFCLVLASHISLALARTCMPIMILAGLGVTIYWYQTELNHSGDVRFYAAFQFLPLTLAILMLALLPSTLLHKRYLALTLILYVLAKGFESADSAIFNTNGLISGHTIKHVISAIGAFVVILAAPVQHASFHRPAFPESETVR